MKINDTYKGWKVLDVKNLPEYKSEGIWLRHEKTEMEIFHLLNDDEENLFGFGFRTIPNDSTGVAHIIEHSVLAGSEKYPLKDPFIVLNSQSIKTYLNAMTYPDKTVYPAASFVEKDYFNLMAVYGDAVFFPLLREVIFKQEGHRVEIDEKGELSIQGVVYNEMKGNYSSFDDTASSQAVLGILKGTAYEYDSGGDPAHIPELTYGQFKAFHKAYYNPSNCRLFLAGNIPTEKQIDFINENFVEPWLSKNPDFTSASALKEAAAAHGFRFEPGTLNDFKEPLIRNIPGPKGGENTDELPTFTMSWIVGESREIMTRIKAVLLEELLLGHDGSPLTRVLLESGLGEDIAPSSGTDSELAWTIFNAGLRGVKKEKTGEVEKVIWQELERISREGVSQKVLDSVLMGLEFSLKEIKRGSGPFSMRLMGSSYTSWMNGGTPYETLLVRQAFEEVKKEIAADSDFIKKLVKEWLLDNRKRALITITPEDSFEENQKKAAERQIEKARSECSLEDMKKSQEEMRIFQQTPESEENLKKIPHLKISELTDDIQYVDTEIVKFGDVPVFTHVQPVNGITYLTLSIPVDVFEPEDYMYLPLFSDALTNMGVGNEDWAAVAERIAGIMGGYAASISTESPTKTAFEKAGVTEELLHSGKERARLLYEADCCLGRSWLIVKAKMLDEKVDEGVGFIFENLKNADFSDKKRLHDLLVEYRNDFKASIAPAGHQYAGGRAACSFSRPKAIDEMWNGLSQYFFIQNLLEMKEEDLVEKLDAIKSKLLKSGIVVDVIAEEQTVASVCSILKPKLEGWNAPVAPLYLDDEAFYKLACSDPEIKWFNARTKVGFAAMTIPAHSFGTKESVYEELLGRYLADTILWEKIRTVNGAYGAMASANSSENIFTMGSYRDPVPESSLTVFEEALKEMAERKLTDEELEKVIIAMYSSSKQPRTPSNKGIAALTRLLYGITDEDRAFRMHTILTATAEDIQNAARSLVSVLDKKKTAIIFDEGKKYSGKKVDLPL